MSTKKPKKDPANTGAFAKRRVILQFHRVYDKEAADMLETAKSGEVGVIVSRLVSEALILRKVLRADMRPAISPELPASAPKPGIDHTEPEETEEGQAFFFGHPKTA